MNWDSRFSRYLVWLTVSTLGISLIVSGGILLDLVPVGPITQITSIVPTSATFIRGISAVILIVTAFVYMRADPSEASGGSLVSQGSPPEMPRQPPQLTSAEFDSVMTDALREIHLKDVPYEDTTPHHTLRETAQMAIMVAFSCREGKAEQRLKSGTWTDDPIAEAFLASEIACPVGFRLFRWANPGRAYTIALDRTSWAIVELTTVAQEDRYTASHEPDSDSGGLLSTLRADIEQKRIDTVSLSDQKHREDSMRVPTEYRQSHHSNQTQLEHREINE